MNLLAKFVGFFEERVVLHEKPRAEPEPVYGQGREMKGFFHTLTAEQKARVMSYRGDENHGDPNFKRRTA